MAAIKKGIIEMRGDLRLKILRILNNTATGLIDIADAFLGAGYGKSYRRTTTSGQLHQLRWKDLDKAEKQRYYNLFYNLKKQGLIKEETRGSKNFFAITSKGKTILSLLIKRKKEELPHNVYSRESSNGFVIVAFDVPEKEKRKREWLRSTLKNLGLKMIQKSVWLGKVKIPKRLLEDIHRLRLAGCVEIFEINKTGSLEHLV